MSYAEYLDLDDIEELANEILTEEARVQGDYELASYWNRDDS